jgi:hypothetical protein
MNGHGDVLSAACREQLQVQRMGPEFERVFSKGSRGSYPIGVEASQSDSTMDNITATSTASSSKDSARSAGATFVSRVVARIAYGIRQTAIER